MWSALFVLGILLALAPIFATLPTIAGMVSSYSVAQENPRPEDLSAAIHLSLVLTAIGLSICPVGIALAIVSTIKLWWRKPRT